MSSAQRRMISRAACFASGGPGSFSSPGETVAALSGSAEHMPLAERMAVVKASRAAGLHAVLLGHVLGHKAVVVKILHNIK
jgi:hypothetical protein